MDLASVDPFLRLPVMLARPASGYPSMKGDPMSDEWLTPQQAAECLNCLPETVRVMLCDGFLPGKKVKGQWWVKAVEVERIQPMKPSVPVPEPPASSSLPKVDPGMMEASIALTGVAAATGAFLPGISSISEIVGLIVAVVFSAVTFYSFYGALWLLARYCLQRYCLTGESLLGTGESLLGIEEIFTLFRNLDKIGPYKFMAGGLLFLPILPVLGGILAFVR